MVVAMEAAAVEHAPLLAPDAQGAGEVPGAPADVLLEREGRVGARLVGDGLADVDAQAPRVGGTAGGQRDEQVDVAGLLQLAPSRRSEARRIPHSHGRRPPRTITLCSASAAALREQTTTSALSAASAS